MNSISQLNLKTNYSKKARSFESCFAANIFCWYSYGNKLSAIHTRYHKLWLHSAEKVEDLLHKQKPFLKETVAKQNNCQDSLGQHISATNNQNLDRTNLEKY